MFNMNMRRFRAFVAEEEKSEVVRMENGGHVVESLAQYCSMRAV